MRNKLNITIIFILSLLWLALAQGVCLGAEYYVDAVDGNDANPGTSDAPWQTLNKAQSVAVEGDTVKLRSGNYGVFIDATTVRTNWVTYKADNGHTPVFTYINLGQWDGPYDKYLHFEGIKIENPYTDGSQAIVRMIYVNYIKFVDCTFIGAGQTGVHGDATLCIYLSNGGTGFTWDNCTFYGTKPSPWEEGVEREFMIYFKCLAEDVTVIDCDFDNSGTATVFRGPGPWYVARNHVTGMNCDGFLFAGCDDVIIEDNHIHDLIASGIPPDTPPEEIPHTDALQFYSTGLSADEVPENIIIRRNRLYNTSGQIIILNGFDDPSTAELEQCTNVTIENNLIYGAGGNAKDLFIQRVNGLTLTNNTIDGDMLVRRDVDNVMMRNNLIWRVVNSEDPTMPDADEDYTLVFDWHTSIDPEFEPGDHSEELGMEGFEQLFADYDNHDYRLASDSLAIDFGSADHAPPTDLEGNPRPYGMGYDIGAYEYTLLPRVVISAEPDKGYVSLTIVFTISEIELPNGDIVTYEWDFGEGATSQEKEPLHIYTSSGEYTVTLTVTDIQGYKGQARTHITVLEKEKEFEELSIGCYNNVINPLKGEEALIIVELPNQARVKVDLYNTRGKKIRKLADKEEEAGPCRYYWNGRDDSENIVGSGLYFVHIQAGDYKKTKKIVVVK